MRRAPLAGMRAEKAERAERAERAAAEEEEEEEEEGALLLRGDAALMPARGVATRSCMPVMVLLRYCESPRHLALTDSEMCRLCSSLSGPRFALFIFVRNSGSVD